MSRSTVVWETLVEIIRGSPKPVAIMCRERHWFKCHRRFVSDSLAGTGYRVVHIIDGGRAYEHRCVRAGTT